jgi:hypothetical protein
MRVLGRHLAFVLAAITTIGVVGRVVSQRPGAPEPPSPLIPATATPAGGALPATPPPGLISAKGPPLQPRDLWGTTLRWAQTHHTFHTGGHDPANGVPLTGELWVRLDEAGYPLALRSTYRYPDGSLHSDELHIRDRVFTRTPPNPAVVAAIGVRTCFMSSPSAPALLHGAGPEFVSPASLSIIGFRLSPVPVVRPLSPATSRPPRAGPARIFDQAAGLHRWERTERHGGITTAAYEVNDAGRVIAWETRTHDERGQRVSEQRTVVGALEVYRNDDTPADACP